MPIFIVINITIMLHDNIYPLSDLSVLKLGGIWKLLSTCKKRQMFVHVNGG